MLIACFRIDRPDELTQLLEVRARSIGRCEGGEKRNNAAIRRTNARRSANFSELKFRYLYFGGYARERIYGFAMSEDGGTAATAETGCAPAM